MFWSVAFESRSHIYLIRQQIVAEPLWILKSDKTCILRWPFSEGNKAKIHHQQKVVEFSVGAIRCAVEKKRNHFDSVFRITSNGAQMYDAFVFRVNYCQTDPECTRITYITGILFVHAFCNTRHFGTRTEPLPIFSSIWLRSIPKAKVCVCVYFVRIQFVLAFFCELTANRTHYFITLLCSKSLLSCENLRIVFYRAQLSRRKRESKLNRSMVASRLKPLWLILLLLKAKLFNISNSPAFL